MKTRRINGGMPRRRERHAPPVTRHRLWTCVTSQLGCPASQSESVQPWRGGCRLTLIMSPAHVKDDETPREAMQGSATFFVRDKERRQPQSLDSRTRAAVYFHVYPEPSRGIFVSNGLDHGVPLRRPLGEEHHGWTSPLHRSQAGWL